MGFTRLLAAGLTAAVLANLLSSGSADLRRPLTDKEVDALAEQWDEVSTASRGGRAVKARRSPFLFFFCYVAARSRLCVWSVACNSMYIWYAAKPTRPVSSGHLDASCICSCCFWILDDGSAVQHSAWCCWAEHIEITYLFLLPPATAPPQSTPGAAQDEEEDPDDYDVIMKKKMENRGGGGAGFDLDALKGLSPEEAQQHMGAASAKGQTKMLFVQFNPGIEQTEMEKKMGFWTGQLMNNALALKAYPIETEQMLVTIDDGAKSPELIKFLTSQQEIDRVELDQVKHFGVNSWSKKNSGKAEKKRAETEKKNKVRGDKYQARKAREEKLVEEGKDPFKENLKKGAKKKKKKTAKGKKKKGGAKKKKKKPKDEL